MHAVRSTLWLSYPKPSKEPLLRMSTLSRLIVLVLTALWLSGCATYGAGITGAIQDVQRGDYVASETKLQLALNPTGSDRLLYHLELAVVKHLQGDFAASNRLLDTAERIADDLETTLMSDLMVTMMSNPRQGAYPGADFEKVFINYYKALNYFALAQIALDDTERRNALEGARIESRRLIIRLNDINSRKGTFGEMKDEEQQTFSQLLKVFRALQGNLINMDRIRYRDDAMAHYLTGITFEMNGEYDDARISYQRAAKAYEDGYAQQYRLDDGMTAQAWFDTVRMMRRAGGYDTEWRRLAKQKLSKEQQADLDNWTRDKAQLIVVEHKGLAPHRKEMNLELSANPNTQTLQLSPYFHGNDPAKLGWFYVLYADKGIVDAVANYLDAVEVGYWLNSFTKTVYVGPLWKTAEDLGLITAIGSSMRVTVPYYEPVKPLGTSSLNIGGQNLTLYKASNPALMAVQEQMTRAGYDIQMALARSSLKAITAQTVGQAGGSYAGLLAMAGKLAAQLTDAAETRNWLLLPQEIRVRRVALDAGEHTLSLESQMPAGVQRVDNQLTLQPGEIHFWRVRTLPVVGHTPEAPVKQIKNMSN